jgi:RNA polymerase sigma-70 factor (ECF subfamily)
LFGIATNLVRHHVRGERRRLIAYARTGVDPVFQPDMDAVDSRVDAGALGPRLALGLASLRAAERDVLLLYAWADLGYEEIAQALSIPVGTVRSRLHRARRRVRELLEAGGQSGDVPLDEGVGDG